MNPTYNTIVVNDESTELTLLGAPSCVMLIVGHPPPPHCPELDENICCKNPLYFFLGS